MTDTTKPTQEHRDRAASWLAGTSMYYSTDYARIASLADNFAIVDAIARRRAIEDAIEAVRRCTTFSAVEDAIIALLRAPTSEQPRPAPLSPEEQEKRAPPPVEAIACALQDRVHK